MGDTVRVYTDLKARAFEVVPEEDVPAGYLRVAVPGVGEGYVHPGAIRATTATPRHPPFPPALRAELARILDALLGAYPLSLDEFEGGFRADAHPWREIALWDRMAEVMGRACGRPRPRGVTGTPADILKTLLSAVNNGPATRDRPARGFRSVSDRSAEKVYALWYAPDLVEAVRLAEEKFRRLLGPALAAPPVPDRVPLHALLDEAGTGPNLDAGFDVREFLAGADVILGVDVPTGEEFLVYGLDFLQRVVAAGVGTPARVARVEVDQGSDELELLLALVAVVRGRYDYGATDAA